MKSKLIIGLAIIAGALSITTAQNATTSRLETVKKRGKLICGVNDKLPGFGFLDSNGKYSGFDVDFCKGVDRKSVV